VDARVVAAACVGTSGSWRRQDEAAAAGQGSDLLEQRWVEHGRQRVAGGVDGGGWSGGSVWKYRSVVSF